MQKNSPNGDVPDSESVISSMPKAELHVHIEGTFEPELIFEIGQRNNVKLNYNSIDELRSAYQFTNLQEFLDIYYAGADVLLHEQDFFELTMAYLRKCHSQNVRHAEIMFDPQTHTARGVPFEVMIEGISEALKEGEREFGMSTALIMNFLRHLSADEAMQTLKQSLPYKDRIIAIGLDSSELGNPPSKFIEVFKLGANNGFYIQAHAGEEGPADYIWDALDNLSATRIDHGNRCLDDEALIDRLVEEKVPLTLCPLSNTSLCVIDEMNAHPVKTMLDKGLFVTINSDDPSYFGGYMNENFQAIQQALDLSQSDLQALTSNSFEASYLPNDIKAKYAKEVDRYFEQV